MKVDTDLSTLILRLSLGIVFLAHGLLKIFVFTLPGTVTFFESVGLFGWLAYVVTAVEILAGAAIVVGFMTPIAAISMIPILFGAFWVHAGNGWLFSSPNGGWEYPLFLLATTVALLFAGNGRYSVTK